MQPVYFSSLSPAQSIEAVGRAGVLKANMRPDKIFMSAVMAGMLLSFACATLLTANTSPWAQTNAPGTIRVLSALVFPYGLVMIVLSGVELCTGSFLFTTVSVLQGRLSIPKALVHWVLTFLGNLAGSLFLVAIISGYGGLFSAAPYLSEVHAFTTTKQLTPMWHQIFLRGIGANWLVCMACFLGGSGRDYASKLVGIWFPTFAFVSLGLDHVVANMFFVPTGIWYGTPGVTVGLYIWKGIIPALIGNILGGGLFVGAFFWYLHLSMEAPVAIDGMTYEPLPANDKPLFNTRNFSLRTTRTASDDEEKAIAMGNNQTG